MNEICLSCRKHTKCGRAKVETIGCGYYVPMTNEEYIKSLNTEQLAEWIFQIFGEGVAFGETHGKTKLFPNDDIIHEGLVLEWLKQPHRD